MHLEALRHPDDASEGRAPIAAWTADPAGSQVLRFTTPRQLDLWIATSGPAGPLTAEQAS